MKASIITICFLISFTSLNSQFLRCANSDQVYANLTARAYTRTNNVVFPLVFHVLESPQSPSLSTNKILDLVRLLNEDFKQKQLLVVPGFEDLLTTAGIAGFEFKIAQVDPNANPSNGIIRKNTSILNIGNLTSQDQMSVVKSAQEGGSSAWDTENYINIWIAERSISLGTTVAENTLTEDEEGIVLSYEAVLDFPKTLSHEMGHYFGLLHPWGNRTGCDDEEDGIEDTPFQSKPNFQCEIIAECTAVVQGGNIMDFGPDECLVYFTKLQAQYMQNFAAQYKEELIDSDDCFYDNLEFNEVNITWNWGNGTLQIYPDEDAEIQQIIVYDLSGRIIQDFDAKRQGFLNIPLPGIPPGIYVLRMLGESFDSTRKIMLGQ